MANSLNKVTTKSILDATIATADIAADAVTGAKIADDAVGAEHIDNLDASIKWLDDSKALFGTGSDLEIYHNDTAGYIHSNKGKIRLQVPGSNHILLEGDDGTYMGIFKKGDSVDLYYNDSKKLSTTSSGAQIEGASGDSSLTINRTNAAGSDGNTFGNIIWSDNNANTVAQFRAVRDTAVDDAALVASTRPTGGSITERFRIDSSGRVGIGESVSNMTNGKLTVKIDTDKHIGFSGSQGEVGNVPALVAYQDNGSLQSMGFRGTDLRFATGSAERLRVTDNGLTFNGDTAAANALSDYEEGTWTPDFYYHSSVSNVAGHYTKIGRMVYAYFTGTFYSSSSSQQYISNLPFTAANISGGVGGVARGYQNYDIQNGPIYFIEGNTTKLWFYKDNGVNFTAADGNGMSFRGMAIYTTT